MQRLELYGAGTILLGVVGYAVGLIFFGLALWAFIDGVRAYLRGDLTTASDEGGKFMGNIAYSVLAVGLTRAFM